MDAQAAAKVIRAKVDLEIDTKADPVERRGVSFVEDVVKHLGMALNHLTFTHVADVLGEHGIAAPPGEEYPKWVDVHSSQLEHDKDGVAHPPEWVKEKPHHKAAGKVSVIVSNRDEEERAKAQKELDRVIEQHQETK